MTRDGAFAPWVHAPERDCLPVPDGVSGALAALAELLCIAMQALRVAGDVAGRRVLVMGPGTIGQGIAVLARRAGAAQVVAGGRNDAARRRPAVRNSKAFTQALLTMQRKTPYEVALPARGIGMLMRKRRAAPRFSRTPWGISANLI
jgi:threonine dehydrogenase-like Zn-dependent dehydrogenase